MTKRKLDTYTVGYRTGGTENFKWNRTLPYMSGAEAERSKESCERMGYPAHIYITRELDAIGLPETYE